MSTSPDTLHEQLFGMGSVGGILVRFNGASDLRVFFPAAEDVLTILATKMNALKEFPFRAKYIVLLSAELPITANLAAGNEPPASPEVTAAVQPTLKSGAQTRTSNHSNGMVSTTFLPSLCATDHTPAANKAEAIAKRLQAGNLPSLSACMRPTMPVSGGGAKALSIRLTPNLAVHCTGRVGPHGHTKSVNWLAVHANRVGIIWPAR
jgi:hypothetical protein